MLYQTMLNESPGSQESNSVGTNLSATETMVMHLLETEDSLPSGRGSGRDKSEEASAFADVMRARASHEDALSIRLQEQSNTMREKSARSERLANRLIEVAKRLLNE